MKDQILKHIENNRDQFDKEIPDDFVWDNIHKELHPEKKRRVVAWWKMAAAVIPISFISYLLLSNFGKTEDLAMNDSNEIPQKTNAESAEFSTEDLMTEQETGPGQVNDLSEKIEGSLKKQENTLQQSKQTKELQIANSNITLKATDALGCSGGDANIVVNGGTYSYTWSATGSTVNPSGIAPGTYEVQSNGHTGYRNIVSEENISRRNYRYSDNDLFVSERSPKQWKNKEVSKLFSDGEVHKKELGETYFSDFSGELKNEQDQQLNLGFTGSFGAGLSNQWNDRSDQSFDNPGLYYEKYETFNENPFEKPTEAPLSTFSIDVDAAGYSNLRRFINDGYIPSKDVVKLEEMINYFDYKWPQPKGEHPFSITTEYANCPWNKKNRILQVGIKGKNIAKENLPANNLVFLLDVSGSMNDANKLGLVKKGFKLLVDEMREEDYVSIVVYAGAAGEVLPPTSGAYKEKILAALNNLNAGGSTAGGEGIELAYKLAEKNFNKKGNNRIILATDGDFNVGMTGDDELAKLIEEKRETGIFLSVMGFGSGNLNNSMMEKVADNGNGNYSYIDNVMEAKKVFVTEMGATLYTIAKDVKLQLEFNPRYVESYRLLGYENRMLAPEDFDNDLKDAGELGAGHTVVALYEIVPSDEGYKTTSSSLKYQTFMFSEASKSDDLVTIKFRYKEPQGTKSKLITKVVRNYIPDSPSENMKFATSVAEFGLLMRESEYRADASYESLIERAKSSKGTDENGYRAEFIRLAEQGQLLFEDYITNYRKMED